MEALYAFLIWTAITCSAAFAAGRYLPMGDVADEIQRTGETTIQKTVYSCEPVATMVRGRRMELK